MPDDLLSLNLGQVQAVIDGYSDRTTDQVNVAVWSGYYSGYYTRGKHPKSPTDIIKNLLKLASKHKTKTPKTAPVDINDEIAKFAERELRFVFAEKGGTAHGNGESRS